MLQEKREQVMIAAISKMRYIANNSFVIISKQGTIVVVDPFRVDNDIKPDIIVVTHCHYDHFDESFINRSECCKLIASTESFSYKDVTITGIAASHKGEHINKNNPDNVIYILEMDGLRIAHFGDTGQVCLTEEQLKDIGRVDIAMMQFANPNSGFTISNEKGLGILKQVKPVIVVPTHAFGLRNAHLGNKWFLMPVHGVGKTLKSLKRKWAPVSRRKLILADCTSMKKQCQEVVWFNKTMKWKEIAGIRNNMKK